MLYLPGLLHVLGVFGKVDDVGFRRALRLKRVGRLVILSERIKYNLFYWFINFSHKVDGLPLWHIIE